MATCSQWQRKEGLRLAYIQTSSRYVTLLRNYPVEEVSTVRRPLNVISYRISWHIMLLLYCRVSRASVGTLFGISQGVCGYRYVNIEYTRVYWKWLSAFLIMLRSEINKCRKYIGLWSVSLVLYMRVWMIELRQRELNCAPENSELVTSLSALYYCSKIIPFYSILEQLRCAIIVAMFSNESRDIRGNDWG